MHILHVTPYFEHAWAYGGIPRVAAAQVYGLAARGHRLTVATTDAFSDSSRLSAEQVKAGGSHGVDVRVFPNLSNRLAFRSQLYLPRGLGRFLRRHAGDFDVAHLHGCHNLPGAIAARRLHRAGIPYVLQPNGTAPRIERRRLAKALFDATVGRRTLSDADAVIAVSEAEQRQLHDLGVEEERICTVPNPLDLDEIDAAPLTAPAPWNLDCADVVLYLGQITPRKRVDLVLRAFTRLQRPDLGLVVAGGTPRTEGPLRRLAGELGIGGKTEFVGVLPGTSRLDALRHARVLVYPTEQEIFGLVPLEALLCGTPAIVADGCGSAEVIRRTGGGQVVPPGDAEALAAAISEAVDHADAWSGEVQKSAAVVRELYSAEVVGKQLEELYLKVCGSERREDPTGGLPKAMT